MKLSLLRRNASKASGEQSFSRVTASSALRVKVSIQIPHRQIPFVFVPQKMKKWVISTYRLLFYHIFVFLSNNILFSHRKSIAILIVIYQHDNAAKTIYCSAIRREGTWNPRGQTRKCYDNVQADADKLLAATPNNKPQKAAGTRNRASCRFCRSKEDKSYVSYTPPLPLPAFLRSILTNHKNRKGGIGNEFQQIKI